MEIGERIQSLRKARHMGVNDLAAEAGMPADSIEAVEAGHRQLSAQEITLLARALEVEPDAFLSDPDEPVEKSTLIPTDKLNALLKQMQGGD